MSDCQLLRRRNFSKITQSSAKDYACCFKALADPMRIRILNLLANNDNPVCVCNVKRFPIEQSSISII